MIAMLNAQKPWVVCTWMDFRNNDDTLKPDQYGWYTRRSSTILFCSWNMHGSQLLKLLVHVWEFCAWIKKNVCRPFNHFNQISKHWSSRLPIWMVDLFPTKTQCLKLEMKPPAGKNWKEEFLIIAILKWYYICHSN